MRNSLYKFVTINHYAKKARRIQKTLHCDVEKTNLEGARERYDIIDCSTSPCVSLSFRRTLLLHGSI